MTRVSSQTVEPTTVKHPVLGTPIPLSKSFEMLPVPWVKLAIEPYSTSVGFVYAFFIDSPPSPPSNASHVPCRAGGSDREDDSVLDVQL